jgi:uncharacterized protein
MRTITPVQPSEMAAHHGLAYSLWLPAGDVPPRGGVVILHGAGSCKENHHDYARAALASGLAAIAFDQRGHGSSEGAMDGHELDDVATMAALLQARVALPEIAISLRGSSMGGYLAILAAPPTGARAVVAICPASAEGLRRSLLAREFSFDADVEALEQFLSAHELSATVESLDVPLLLLHAEGDERVPVEQSRELAGRMHHAQSRLITVPGGHHRSVQHDPELMAISLRWLERVLAQ